MLDDVGELFDESKPQLVKIQVDGLVDGDSETTTGIIKNRNKFQVNKVKGERRKRVKRQNESYYRGKRNEKYNIFP